MVVDDRRDRLVLPPGAGPGEAVGARRRGFAGDRAGARADPGPDGRPSARGVRDRRPVDAPWFRPGAILLLGLTTAFGWSAARSEDPWAAALPHGMGISLRYGWWRLNRVWLWTTLALVAIGLGLVLLVVPGCWSRSRCA